MIGRAFWVILVCAALVSTIIIERATPVEKALTRASALVREGKPARARREVSRAISADPSRIETYLIAMDLYRRLGSYRQAASLGELLLHRAAEPRAVVALNDDQKAALYADTAHAYWFADDYPSAERAYRAALNLAPDDGMMMNNLGYFYADTGRDLPTALKLTRKAAKLHADSGVVLDSLGWALLKSGKAHEAARILEKAVALEPNSGEIRYHLGVAHAMLEHITDARIELKKALLLDGTLDDARRHLTELMRRR